MNKIRAFVGYSFAADDQALVATFLKYFDVLAKSMNTFSWTHAEPAEPKALAEKVMSLLSDCNVLIAICTKRHRVIAPDVLTDTIFPGGFLKAKTSEFKWNTSEWITQEIGFALGGSCRGFFGQVIENESE
jgi:hypothetical protein